MSPILEESKAKARSLWQSERAEIVKRPPLKPLARIRLAIVGLTILGCVLGVKRVFAWDNQGNQIIAGIAERHLSAQTREEIASLLSNRDLSAVASYMDDLRMERPEIRSWLYVNIPRSAKTYDPAQHCPAGNCAIEKISEFYRVLADVRAPRQQRAEALKLLVNLVGDLHQPFHVSSDEMGGTKVSLTFFKRKTNLHAVWDIYLLQKTNRSVLEYVELLESRLQSLDISALQRGDVVTWALQAHRIADEKAYVLPGGSDQSIAYYDTNLPAFEDQLMKGGVRLARILNEAFAIPPPSSPAALPRHSASPPANSVDQSAAGNSQAVNPPQDDRSAINKESSPWIGVTKAVLGVMGAYLTGIIALLLLSWKRGSAILSKNFLSSLASKPLLVLPGIARLVLFLGYQRRILQIRDVDRAAKSYFGLPAQDPYGSAITFSPTGDSLHEAIVKALGAQQPVLIIGSGGAGKTTLLSRLVYLASTGKPPFVGRPYRPVYVSALYYTDSLTKAIADTLRERDGIRVDEEAAKAQLQSGGYLILFDGASEVTTDKQKAIDEIFRTTQNSDYRECRFIIATRPPELLPEDVRTFHLKPLVFNEIKQILDSNSFSVAQKNQIIKQLEHFDNRPLDPLLLSMILEQGTEDQVGANRAKVYEGYFRRLLRVGANEDLWFGWRVALESLAFWFLLNTGKRGAGLPHEILVDQISERKEGDIVIEGLASRLQRQYRLPVQDELAILRKLEEAGLLQRGRRWRFTHDTFEEYFAASYMASYFETRESLPNLEKWSDSEAKQRDFAQVIVFIRELVEPESLELLSTTNLPEHWKDLLKPRETTSTSDIGQDPKDYKVVYDSMLEGFDLWGMFSSIGTFESSIRFLGSARGDGEFVELTTLGDELVGINKAVETLHGRAEFSYKVLSSGASNSNVVFFMIPMRGEMGDSALLEVGAEYVDDPRNAHSPYRIKYQVPTDQFGDGQWHRARLNFDFRETPTACYSIFAPRINEGCPEQKNAQLLVSKVKILSYEAAGNTSPRLGSHSQLVLRPRPWGRV